MGHRANLVIVQGGEYVLYYDHWAATTLDVNLFWGPKTAKAYIAERDPVGPDHWLNDVWCEGAVLLNDDARTLLFFGGEDIEYDLPLRHAHMALLRQQWPGWDVRWAHRGIIDIASAVGEDTAPLRTEPKPNGPIEVAERPEWNEMLVTLVRNGERFASHANDDYQALVLGPSSINIDTLSRHRIPTWAEEFPMAGLHIDCDAKHLAWWCVRAADLEQDIAAAWEGWNVTWLRDDVAAHMDLAGLDLALLDRPAIDLQSEVLDRLERQLSHTPRNFALDSAQPLADAGHTVQISAATNEFRPSAPMDQAEKQNILDGLRSRLPIE